MITSLRYQRVYPTARQTSSSFLYIQVNNAYFKDLPICLPPGVPPGQYTSETGIFDCPPQNMQMPVDTDTDIVVSDPLMDGGIATDVFVNQQHVTRITRGPNGELGHFRLDARGRLE